MGGVERKIILDSLPHMTKDFDDRELIASVSKRDLTAIVSNLERLEHMLGENNRSVLSRLLAAGDPTLSDALMASTILTFIQKFAV